VQPLGDPGTQRDDALLDQLVDGPEVHLGGVDQIAHLAILSHARTGGLVGEVTTTVMWFRRDLRLSDNPALLEACESDGVLPVRARPGAVGSRGVSRRWYLTESLRALDASLRQRRSGLSVVRGNPVRQVLLAAKTVGAARVHVAADYGPYGHRRDREVEQALGDAGVDLVRTGSPYAVAPDRVAERLGRRVQGLHTVLQGLMEHGWRDPVDDPTGATWLALDDTVDLPSPTLPDGLELPEAGEARGPPPVAGVRRRGRLADYDSDRDRPDLDATSHMSVHLKWGEIHPRTMLADLKGRTSQGAVDLPQGARLAGVLRRRAVPAARDRRGSTSPEFARMEYDEPGDQLDAWSEGRTGFPIVDAGMRQLRATGWMHNRVRMIVASFLVKDLHVEWQHGARHFMQWLVDGDLASNQHGWQWTAGCGTDAAPYFRVFNPTSQGPKFDPRAAT
jgi:deoxyribodipyrimidine photo-lyase